MLQSSRPSNAVEAFKALSNDHRLEILELLAPLSGGMSQQAIAQKLGMGDSLAFHHLHKLELAGLIECNRSGYYKLCQISKVGLLRFATYVAQIANANAGRE